ncbi:MAG: helix-turn-helix domain-containing protein [Patescibacteria group bacterium]|nr:helix-turn-helix domain-containing protein [Patescibacteria group bacterium]
MATKTKRSGRPTEYRAEYAQTAYRLTLLGCTDVQVAAAFDVSHQTLDAWKKKFPRFLASIKSGKDQADARVAASLHSRAVGYSHPDTHISQYEGRVIKTKITKHYPPDAVAAIFWLKNRQPKLWRDVHRHEVTGKDGAPVQIEDMSVEELRADMIRRGELTPEGRLVPHPSPR